MWSREIDELGMLNDNQKGDQCSRIARLILIGLMIFIVVGAVAIVVIGIITHETDYGSKQLAGLIGYKMYQVDSIMLIAAGCCLLVIMAVGLVGLLLPQKCLLGLHLSVMSFLSLILFASGILGYVFVGELESSVRGSLKESIVEKYGVEDSITESWDTVQQKFQCCGAYGNENTTTSWNLYHTESFWVKEGLNDNGSYVPASCCDPKTGNIPLCRGMSNTTDEWPPRQQKLPITEKATNYTLYTTGCFDKLSGYLEQNGLLIGTAAVTVGVFMIVEIVMSIFFYRSLH